MAYIAGLGGGYVGGAFSTGYGSIVAVLAHIGGLGMINGQHIGLP